MDCCTNLCHQRVLQALKQTPRSSLRQPWAPLYAYICTATLWTICTPSSMSELMDLVRVFVESPPYKFFILVQICNGLSPIYACPLITLYFQLLNVTDWLGTVRKHRIFLNIFAKYKTVTKPFSLFIKGPGSVFNQKKMCKSLDTFSLSQWSLNRTQTSWHNTHITVIRYWFCVILQVSR